MVIVICLKETQLQSFKPIILPLFDEMEDIGSAEILACSIPVFKIRQDKMIFRADLEKRHNVKP